MKNLLKALDPGQCDAATLFSNGIAAAGAGSGKTKVLATRYAWLIMEKNLKPEEILALTFTNKAVSEMYSRIYNFLLEEQKDNPKAQEALKLFHKARISTLDSFSAQVGRIASRRYGISPDFSSDDQGIKELARDSALRFVLDHLNDPAIQRLLEENKIKKIAEDIFAEIVLEYSPISSPLDFNEELELQKKEITLAWKEKSGAADAIIELLISETDRLGSSVKSIKASQKLTEIFAGKSPPKTPDINPLLEDKSPSPESRQEIAEYFAYLSEIIAVAANFGNSSDFTLIEENFKTLKGNIAKKDGLYFELESIANYALQFSITSGIFRLLKIFQEEFNEKKRASGKLTFNDIAHLAVDALKDHPDIRKVYKDSVARIMIDEFQDNNKLQRDLIYLLAEDPKREEKGIPPIECLNPDKMFFVGDEKQSIYRFRGADVAVFRGLGNDIFKGEAKAQGSISLNHNYRSRPNLIAAFNKIFGNLDEGEDDEEGKAGGVFLPINDSLPDYEAIYRRIKPPEGSAKETESLVHFCFLDSGRLADNDPDGTSSQDLEAAFIANKIQTLIQNKEKIPERAKEGAIAWRQCRYSDFAILERSYTHQQALEKQFRNFGIPYNTDRPAGLFSDGPVNDLKSYLRLLVYPQDRIAYAALLRSPFMRLSDLALSICMLSPVKEPFSEELDKDIPKEDLQLYQSAREHYRAMKEASRSLPLTELLTKLWYQEGYRYETLWQESSQVYEGLFDLFFEFARNIEGRGKSLAEFLDYLEDVISKEEKPDDMDIPSEDGTGVRIMSIHKSKGLEFPIVFLFDCANSGNNKASSGLITNHEKWGISLKLPQANELPLEGDNYFRRLQRAEEKLKSTAELRRLLYVAMTRAESRLFLTLALPKQNNGEREANNLTNNEWNADKIRERLSQLNAKDSDSQSSFLKLLTPIAAKDLGSLCTIEAIQVLSRKEILFLAAPFRDKSRSDADKTKAAADARPFYEHATLIEKEEVQPETLSASKLHISTKTHEPAENNAPPATDAGNYSISLLEKAGLNAADFGTIVHAVLEGTLNKHQPFIPSRIVSRLEDEKDLAVILEEAGRMADKFLASGLGIKCLASGFCEPEYPIITAVTIGDRSIPITGQIDLLYEDSASMVIVDFKTDKVENPEDHYEQLAVYQRAVSDIFGKPVKSWLYYLRSGNAVDVSDQAEMISIEKAAEAYCAEVMLR
ncbi:UvrD-helicase domain-containing protein [Leadbettera azotonutricia]|uniref:DNA 3'-5' helicase n=1 Tax=Leadbettera azotonutricia (strain ATCC BAA-888 / DSM 13862 / ZAS-9) TaxID=545695 RepID=F5YEF4_LEAAZ|nr:UvrD-helicase domain-containing protein [Leadbettera azotonutricia]AEF81153.1 ATP-dependent DNA helicase, UvrD/Rep family [Leadbettera azotonutricia ZAS-9]